MKLFTTIDIFNNRHQKWFSVKTWTVFGDSENTKKLIVSIFQSTIISDQLYLPTYLFYIFKRIQSFKIVLLFYSGKYL